MTVLTASARLLAAVVAMVAIAGLAIQFSASLGRTGSAGAALWSMLRFFTIIGNALTAATLLGAALGVSACGRPRVLGGLTLIMGLIGVVYATMLRDVMPLTGPALLASRIMHDLVPPLVALFWIGCVPRGCLHWTDPLRWALLPLAYLPYAFARAALDGRYPYPFLDAGQLGWAQVAVNAAGIAAGFLLAGLALTALDRLLARRRRN